MTSNLNALKRFKCLLCDDLFTNTDSLETHLAATHVMYMAYECDYCKDALFPSDQSLRDHYQIIHRKKVFTIRYRVSPELDERRKRLQELLAQSISQSSNTSHHNAETSSTSYLSQPPQDCTTELLQSELHVTNDFLAKFETENGNNTTLENDQIFLSCFSDSKAIGDDQRLFATVNYVLMDDKLNSPLQKPQLVGQNDGDLLDIKKSKERKHKAMPIKTILAKNHSKRNEHRWAEKLKGHMVECLECKRAVANYRNSMLIHVSTHHCDLPIFECLANGCGKKWYSISARTKEHIESKHGGDTSLLRDNRRKLLPDLKYTAQCLFPAYSQKFNANASYQNKSLNTL